MKIALATIAALLTSVSVLGSGTPALADATISVSLTDYAVSPSPSSATPGTVTFNVSNDAPIIHDFHVIQTDLPPGGLPVDQNTAEVDLSQLNEVASTQIIQPGGSDSASPDLAEGSYVLICNLPGHYGAGMNAAFTVAAVQPPANTPADGEPVPTDDGTTPVPGGSDDTGGTGSTVGSPTSGYGPQGSDSGNAWRLLVVPAAGIALFFGAAALRRSRSER